MKNFNVVECPKCDSREIGRGKQSGYAGVTPYERMGFNHSLVLLICTDCGWVIGSYVEKPAAFKKTVSDYIRGN
ncbi:transcription initiation factor TFIIIB [Sporosarcina sp. UB5]|uniref:transcription initiation factor TFIIIB n=1 Tax=Sporosarcina sp. UB5 TaxID=3047463 RepID=UPI003D7A2ECE